MPEPQVRCLGSKAPNLEKALECPREIACNEDRDGQKRRLGFLCLSGNQKPGHKTSNNGSNQHRGLGSRVFGRPIFDIRFLVISAFIGCQSGILHLQNIGLCTIATAQPIRIYLLCNYGYVAPQGARFGPDDVKDIGFGAFECESAIPYPDFTQFLRTIRFRSLVHFQKFNGTRSHYLIGFLVADSLDAGSASREKSCNHDDCGYIQFDSSLLFQ
jgi:hypothetical protein